MNQVAEKKHAYGQKPGWADEMSAILDAYRQAGGDVQALEMPEVATLVVSANDVLVAHEIPGIHFQAEPLEHGVKASIRVDDGVKIEKPVHLCFGVIPAEGIQEIVADYEIGEGATAQFLAHCSFPNAVKVEHRMRAKIHIGKNASLTYTEEHFHGSGGGVDVLPYAEILVEEGGRYITTFNITRGRIGRMEIDYQVDVRSRGVVEMITKAYGHADDKVKINEVVRLNGEKARGLTRTRVAVRDSSLSQVYTTMEGNAPFAKGHMDCTEIVLGKAEARNTPVVVVRDDNAQVTHEAAIGSVNRKELETLLARGLDEDEAVDLIIRGMIR